MTPRRRLVALMAGLAALGAVVVPAKAAATTRCGFGGPAGTHRVLRLDLREGGSEFLNIVSTGSRASRPTSSTESWHLAQGTFLVDELTGEMVAHRISNQGTNPRTTVVDAGGRRIEQDTAGPDAPFAHRDLLLVDRLPPSSYLVIAFGSDGDPAAPNDGWGGFVEVSGSRSCAPVGTGALLDVNHTDFTGGTQVSTVGASGIDGASHAVELAGDFVVGFMDASTQLAGEATLDYRLPGGSGTVDDAIVPFLSPAGQMEWTASAHGVSPVISIVALAVDV